MTLLCYTLRPYRTSIASACILLALLAGSCSSNPDNHLVAGEQQVSPDSTGATIAVADVTPTTYLRLTVADARENLPPLPSDAELLELAAQVAPEDRSLWHGGGWSLPIHLHPRDAFGGAIPIFALDGSAVLGIYVDGPGLISRVIYDDPDTDFEQLAREALGADEYEVQLEWRRRSNEALANGADQGDLDSILADLLTEQ